MDQKQVRFRAVSIIIIVAVVVFSVAIFFGIESKNTLENIPQISTTTVTQTPPVQNLVYLIIEGPQKTASYDIPATGLKTVIDALRVAEKQGLALQSKDYGGELGIFIEGINGKTNDSKNNLYWTLYINGKQSPTGASATLIKPGDTISWKFEISTL